MASDGMTGRILDRHAGYQPQGPDRVQIGVLEVSPASALAQRAGRQSVDRVPRRGLIVISRRAVIPSVPT